MALTLDHRGNLHAGSGARIHAGRHGLDRLASVLHWIEEMRRAWAHRRSVYRTRRALDAVSDRTLRDLGIDRSAILSTAKAAADREFGIPTPHDRLR